MRLKAPPHATVARSKGIPPPPPFPTPPPIPFSPAWNAYAKKLGAWWNALPPAERARLNAKAAAQDAANRAAALRTRPDPMAAPADQNSWLNANVWAFANKICAAYPEWHGEQTGNGMECRAFIQRSSSDWVHWYEAPNGTWTYDHHYGTGFDAGNALAQAGAAFSQATNIVKQAASSAATAATTAIRTVEQPFVSAVSAVDAVMDKELDNLASVLPPQARGLVSALKSATHFLIHIAEDAIDPTRIDWRQVADYVEAATSTIPVLGTAVSDVVATAEVLYDAISSTDPLEAALRAAYDYALSSTPGAAALDQWIRPVFNVLVDIAVKHEPPTRAVITEAVNQAPDSPSIGSLSPRSIAASLAAFIVGKLGVS